MRIMVRYLGLTKRQWKSFSKECYLYGKDYATRVNMHYLQERSFNFNHDKDKPIFMRDICDLVEKRTKLKVPGIVYVIHKNEILELI